jgi:phospholipid-binding lipoprotein MlaA
MSMAVGGAALLLAGCASDVARLGEAGEIADPAEKSNRAVFDANAYLDRNVLKPTASGYKDTLPAGMQRGVHNFLTNLSEPSVAINDVLQGNVARGASTIWRFAVNTTAGGLGIFDIASDLGFEHHDADFGQTLGVWGVGEGPYLTLPLLGPSNARDATGTVVGFVLNPVSLGAAQPLVTAGQALNARVANAEALDSLERGSVDFYASLRSAYIQRRRALVQDGKEPGSQLRNEPVIDISLDDIPPSTAPPQGAIPAEPITPSLPTEPKI